MTEYVIVSFLSKPIDLIFKRSNWPLHLTIVGNFYTELSSDSLTDILFKTTQGAESIVVPSISRQMFGSKHNLPVTELYRTESLHNLHYKILNNLNSKIKLRTPQFNNDGYRPHITEKYENKLVVGEKFQLQTLSLVKLDNDNAQILKTIQLRQSR